jgi:hypothetical protein
VTLEAYNAWLRTLSVEEATDLDYIGYDPDSED